MAAPDFQRRNPLNAIDLQLGRLFRRRLVERTHQIIDAADPLAINFLDRVAINDGDRLVVCARFQTSVLQRTFLAYSIDFDAATKSELSEDEDDVHQGGRDQ